MTSAFFSGEILSKELMENVGTIFNIVLSSANKGEHPVPVPGKKVSPAKKYKLYKSSINKSIHFVQRSRAANRDNSVLLLSSTYCYCLDQLSSS